MYNTANLSAAEAQAAITAMLAEANKEAARPLAFAIVDGNGDLVAFAKMDNIGAGPRGICIKKAYTSARMRADTKALADRFAASGMSMSTFGDPNLIALQGGVVITAADGSVVGAIGVSGRMANEDEDVAKVGLAAIKGA